MAINLPIVSKYDDKGIKQAEASLAKFGKAAAGVAAAATAAVAGIAVKSIQEFAKFDSKLNQSIAIMGDVSEAMRGDMADAAREVAKQTTFSADQAAESFFFLASAGLSAEASIAAMPQVAKFAQAGMFDMALATDLATDAQSALGLSSKDAQENLENLTRITDVFVKANTLANTSVEQLATAFTTKAGTALKTVGKDVEEGAAALALFADQGVKGELAGTQLTNTIFGLTDRAQKVPEAFEALGVSVFDAEGNMRNFADIADDFGLALGDMTTEQKVATLSQLGFTKQARAGLLMLTGQGDALRNYEEQLRSAGGMVDEVANKQLQSLSAQFEILKSRIADVGISIGGALAPSLLGLMESVGPIVDEAAPLLVEFFAGLAPLIAKLVQALPQLVSVFVPLLPVLGGLFDAGLDIIGMVLPILIQLFQTLMPVVQSLLPPLMHLLESIFIPLMPAVQALITAIGPLIEALLPLFTEVLYLLLPLITELLEGVFIPLAPAIIAVVTAITPLLTEYLPMMIDILKTFVIPILNTVIQLFKVTMTNAIGVFAGALDGLGGFLKVFFGTFRNIWNQVSGFFRGIVNGMIGFFEGFGNTVIDIVNNIARAINSIRISIPAIPPFFGGAELRPINLPILPRMSIPRLAEGGIVMPRPGGVFANLAEAGKPEAVIPLDRLGSLGGNNYTINVNAGIGTDGGRVGQLIVDEIKRFERANGPVFASA